MALIAALAQAPVPAIAADGGAPASVAAAPQDAPPLREGIINPSVRESMNFPDMPYSEALRLARTGEVEEVLVRSGGSLPTLFVRLKDGRVFRSTMPSFRLDDGFIEGGALVRADNGGKWQQAAVYLQAGLSVAMTLLLLGFMVGMLRQMRKGTARDGSKSRKYERVTFADVAGQEAAKFELREAVEFLRDPARFSVLGARAPRGVLLEGPPGNGKTLLAKAVAGEANVPFLHLDGPEILEMFAGLGARRIRKTFAEARRKAKGGLIARLRKRPAACVLFIDEIDSIGGRRGQGGGSDVQQEREQILNQLLVEMDGLGKGGGLLIIAATNRGDMLDPALVRPGRFDRRALVPPPDLDGREGILRVHAAKVKLAPEVDLREVARMTPGFSGAETANIVNEAALVGARGGRDAVDMACFHEARDRLLMGAERSSAGVSNEERRVAAYHEAGHAIVALRSPHSDPVHKVSIVPRGRALGVVIRLPERDRLLISRRKLDADLAVAMGGRAAEELIFGDDCVTSGAVSDIEQATRIAREMSGRWGMSKELGRVNYLGSSDGGSPAASAATLARLDEVVRAQVEEAYERAMRILRVEVEGMHALVARLMEADTLSGDEARAILDGALPAAPSLVAAE